MTIHSLSLALHIAAGTIALVAFWSAGLMAKGTPRHRAVGRAYLMSMVVVIASGIPLVLQLVERGQPVGALFLTYLLLLVGNACWSAWRAIRDRRDRDAYFGPMYLFLAALTAASGLGIAALGLQVGATLLVVFGALGAAGGLGAWHVRRRARHDPKWWLKEHYGNMIGNGVATHIAFLGIGVRRLLPGVDPGLQQHLAWFLPLGGALIAGWWLHRRYGRGATASRAVPSRSALPAE